MPDPRGKPEVSKEEVVKLPTGENIPVPCLLPGPYTKVNTFGLIALLCLFKVRSVPPRPSSTGKSLRASGPGSQRPMRPCVAVEDKMLSCMTTKD